MKGPGYKLSHDVRRTWKCPACGRERKLMGDVTSLTCECKPEGTFMAIAIERTVAPRPFQVVRDHDVRSSEFGIEDLPVLQPHPSSLPPERSAPRRPRPGSSQEESSPDDTAAEPKPEIPSEAIGQESPAPPPTPAVEEQDDWGEGILEE